MATLPTNRTTSDTPEEHVDDHNEIHRLHNDLDGHLADGTDAHDASAISVLTTGGIGSTTVQAALAELDTEKEAAGTAAAAVSTHAGLADPHTGYVLESLYDANTLLIATADNTPIALAVAASRIVGRKATGDISAMTAAELVAIIRTSLPVELGVAVSDETTDLTTGTAKVTFRLPFAMTLTSVRASLNVASSSGTPTVDINENGTTILSTKLTIDANEKTSTTAAVAAVISDASLADDAEITMDIDVAGTGARGLKVWMIGTRTA